MAAALAVVVMVRLSRRKTVRLATFSLVVVGLGLIAVIASLMSLQHWWPGAGQALPVSFVLLGVVTLLSVEWLTRKLLRLA
jgi:uncharacterized membrane protein